MLAITWRSARVPSIGAYWLWPLAHRLRQQFAQPRINVVIGESLTQIQSAQFPCATRHDREDRGADIGKFAAPEYCHGSMLAMAAPMTPAWPAKCAGSQLRFAPEEACELGVTFADGATQDDDIGPEQRIDPRPG